MKGGEEKYGLVRKSHFKDVGVDGRLISNVS
jgi:hypothetical protein